MTDQPTNQPNAQEQPAQPQTAPAAVDQGAGQQPQQQAAGPAAGGGSQSSAVLTTSDGANARPGPVATDQVGAENIADQMSAVINVHGCNLQQIEVAVAANGHQLDPHPAQPGKWVRRHPVYLACFDTANLDEQGRPAPGAPLELDLDTIRQIYSSRHAHVAAEPPPEDGSHVRVEGMHTVAESDSSGRPTGRVRLGHPGEVAQ